LLITRLRGWSGECSALNFLKLGTDNYCALLLTDVHFSSPNTHNQTHTAHPTCSAVVGIHRLGSVFSTPCLITRAKNPGAQARVTLPGAAEVLPFTGETAKPVAFTSA